MKQGISKKGIKVIEKGIEQLMSVSSLERITRISAQMMLQAPIEEEVTHILRGIIIRGITGLVGIEADQGRGLSRLAVVT